MFDFGARYTRIYPDLALGMAAYANRRQGVFPLGSRGAGRSVWQGAVFQEFTPGGQGGAVSVFEGVKIGVFSVVNANGVVVDRQGIVRACRHRKGMTVAEHHRRRNEPSFSGDHPAARYRPLDAKEDVTRNTTHTVVVINRDLSHAQLTRLAVEVQASLARAIQPYNTAEDGDVVFVASLMAEGKGEVDLSRLSMHIAELAWDAVLASIPKDLPPLPSPKREPVKLESDKLKALAGRYAFAPGQVIQIKPSQDGLLLGRMVEGSDIFEIFLADQWTELYPLDETRFFLDNFWGDQFTFTLENSKASALTLNPGPRAVHLTRQAN